MPHKVKGTQSRGFGSYAPSLNRAAHSATEIRDLDFTAPGKLSFLLHLRRIANSSFPRRQNLLKGLSRDFTTLTKTYKNHVRPLLERETTIFNLLPKKQMSSRVTVLPEKLVTRCSGLEQRFI